MIAAEIDVLAHSTAITDLDLSIATQTMGENVFHFVYPTGATNALC